MSDGTKLNKGLGGDTIQTEDIPDGQGVGDGNKLAVSKLYIGAQDKSEGPVWLGNPLPVQSQELVELLERQTKILMMILMALDSTVNEDDIADM